MAQVAETDRIVINDFRPGIYADYHATGAVHPAETAVGTSATGMNGAATIANTYRCIADRSGALVPLPKLVNGPAAAKINAAHVTGRDAAYLLDGIVLTDFYTEGEVPAQTAYRPAVFLMTGEWVQSDAYRWTVIARMYRLFDTPSTGTQDVMFGIGDTSILVGDTTKAHIGAGQFCNFRAQFDADSFFTYQSVCMVAFGAPDYLATEPAWQGGAIGVTPAGWTDFDTNNGGVLPASNSGRMLGIFPDYDNIATAQTKFLDTAGMTAASYITSHQGRLIAGGREHGDFGENSGGETLGILNEHIHYTPPHDFDGTNGVGEITFGTFGERRPWLSGVIASVSADELLLIKHRDGGLLVRGDVEDPTVVDLPFIHSTGGARCIPAWSPKGLIYGGRNGVYLWAGGESTEKVSNQLDGWFWNPDPNEIERYGTHGRFAWWEPWIIAPNNWLYNTEAEGWWRLDAITDTTNGADAILAADTAPNGDTLYAFPFAFTSSQLVAWRTATKQTLASTYSWQSQPIPATADRMAKIRELRLLATHVGTSAATVTITLTGYSDEGEALTPVTATFTLDANRDRPQLKVLKVAPAAMSHVQVRIQADSGDANQAAPKVHSLSLALADRQHIPSR